MYQKIDVVGRRPSKYLGQGEILERWLTIVIVPAGRGPLIAHFEILYESHSRLGFKISEEKALRFTLSKSMVCSEVRNSTFHGSAFRENLGRGSLVVEFHR